MKFILDVSFKTGVLAILDKSIGWNIGSTRLHLKCSGIGRVLDFYFDAVEIVNQTELCKLTRERIQNVYGAPDGELDVSFKTGASACNSG